MPRGRSRGRGRGRGRTKPRLSRMDAAVDAMLPLGFSEEKVKRHVKELLEVYGGDEGWPFIEEFAYKVLLDSILEERDDQEQVAQNGDVSEDKSCVDKEAGPPDTKESSGAAVAEPRRPHFPCYGWVESDDEDANHDDNFLNLMPASTATTDVPKLTKKRKSRWDLKPSDP